MNTPHTFEYWKLVAHCPDPETDPAQWNDTQCVAAIHAVRVERMNIPGMTLPKLVKRLNALGCPLQLSDYKRIEREPNKHYEYIRNGLVQTVYKALSGDVPAANIYMDPGTLSVMNTVKRIREARSMTYAEMAAELSTTELISEREYRAIEEGVTRHATVSFIIRVADVLNVYPKDLFS